MTYIRTLALCVIFAAAISAQSPAAWIRAASVATTDCAPAAGTARESFLLSRIFAPSDPQMPPSAPWRDLPTTGTDDLVIPSDASWVFAEASIEKPGWHLLTCSEPALLWHRSRRFALGNLPTPIHLDARTASFHVQSSGAAALRLQPTPPGVTLLLEGAVFPDLVLGLAAEMLVEMPLVNASAEASKATFARVISSGGASALTSLPAIAPESVVPVVLRVPAIQASSPGVLTLQVEVLGEGLVPIASREIQLSIVSSTDPLRVTHLSLKTGRLLAYRSYAALRGPMDPQEIGLITFLGPANPALVRREQRGNAIVELKNLPRLANLDVLEVMDQIDHAGRHLRAAPRERWVLPGVGAHLQAPRLESVFPDILGRAVILAEAAPWPVDRAGPMREPAPIGARRSAITWFRERRDPELPLTVAGTMELQAARRRAIVRRARLFSPDLEVAHISSWVHAEAVTHQGSEFAFDCEANVPERRVHGTTQNLRRISFDQEHFSTQDPITVQLDGSEAVLEIDGTTARWHAEKTESGWRAMRGAPLTAKRPERAGSFSSLFLRDLLLVPATGGDEAARTWALARAHTDAALLHQLGSSAAVILDRNLKLEDYPFHSFLLYGRPTDHAVAAQLLVGDPIGFGSDAITVGTHRLGGDDLAAMWVRPRPNHPSALVGCIAPSGEVGRALLDLLPIAGPSTYWPDLLIVNPSYLSDPTAGTVVTGYFGLDWSLESGEFHFQ